MKSELKPCPFCGASGRDLELNTTTRERAGVWTWYQSEVICRSCWARVGGRDTTDKEEAVDTAIAAWNSRIPVEEKKEDTFNPVSCWAASNEILLKDGWTFYESRPPLMIEPFKTEGGAK